jgi:hypothetical protein
MRDAAGAGLSVRRWQLIAAIVALLAVGCSSGARSGPTARAQADRTAERAGTVMTRADYAVPSTAAAWQVVGQKGDTTVDVLTATGTTWKGSVTLRVTVDITAGDFEKDTATRCYRFAFDRSDQNDADAHALTRCPTGAAIALASPAAGPALSATEARELGAALGRLSAKQRGAPETVRHLLAGRFPPPSTTTVGRVTATAVSIDVHYQDRCLIGELPAIGTPRIVAGAGTDCRGG